ncbi:hypothetical protein QOT17_008656 [Balamuthia mandrillaris]
MYFKTALILFGVLLVAQAHAASNINAKLSGNVDVDSSIADITADLKAIFSASLTDSLEISVLTTDLVIDFDTNALEEGTASLESSRLTEDGYFEGSFLINDLSLGLSITLNDETIQGSISFSVAAVAHSSASAEDGLSLSLDEASISVQDLEITASGLGASIAVALQTTLETSINVALQAAADLIVDLGNTLIVTVEAPVRATFESTPRVTVTIESTVEEFEQDREAVVSAFVQVLADIEVGAFANGILIGEYSAGAQGEVDFDFWILDNEDDVSGEEAASEMQAAYESDAEVFTQAGVSVKGFKINASADSAAPRHSSLFF